MRILWIPHAGWHIPQRAHLFCRALSERHEVHVTDWVADFYTLKDYLSKRYLENFYYHQTKDGRITVHRIPRVSPAVFSTSLRKFNQSLFTFYVNRVIQKYQIDAVIGTFVVPPPKAPRLIFDLFDDNVGYWNSYGKISGYAKEILETEQEYLNKADVVVAVSSVLMEKAKKQGTRGALVYIPNGVDVSKFTQYSKVHKDRPFKMVGLVGNQDKIAEVQKVIAAAVLLKDEPYRFLLAGRGMAVPFARKAVKEKGLSNIEVRGYVTPEEANALIASLDVGLCPYFKTPGADASCPIRLLAYSAAGIPVVCTDLEEVRRLEFPNVFLVKDSAEALAEGIQHAIDIPHGQPSGIDRFDMKRLVQEYEAVIAGQS
jgi:glycosyltransferase involved in cell wall biosynthesis